jgi:hypothetical protein
MTNNTPFAYFARVKALQEMILNAQEDLKQLRADAMEEMGVDDMPKEQASEIRADWTAMVAVARLDVKGEIERRKHARKQARMKRVAEECGVQLDLLDETPAAPARRMARAAATKPRGVPMAAVTAAIASVAGPAATMQAIKEVYGDDPPHDPKTGEVLDDDEEPQRAATSEEPAVMHAGGMNERDWQAMGDIPDFLRR